MRSGICTEPVPEPVRMHISLGTRIGRFPKLSHNQHPAGSHSKSRAVLFASSKKHAEESDKGILDLRTFGPDFPIQKVRPVTTEKHRLETQMEDEKQADRRRICLVVCYSADHNYWQSRQVWDWSRGKVGANPSGLADFE